MCEAREAGEQWYMVERHDMGGMGMARAILGLGAVGAGTGRLLGVKATSRTWWK